MCFLSTASKAYEKTIIPARQRRKYKDQRHTVSYKKRVHIGKLACIFE